jgi:uncharacterized membrane protein YhaH (DUF805 family)
MNQLATLFSFRGPIRRSSFLLIGILGVLVKHTVDLAIASSLHRPWDFLNYLMPLGVPVPVGNLSVGDIRFLAIMLAVSVPFAWVGLAITAKRLRTIGWPAWLIVAFFVPIANIVSFALEAAWPEVEGGEVPSAARTSWLSKFVPADRLGAALVALLATAALGTVLVPVGTMLLNSYGWGLFVALPFVQGALAAYVYSLRAKRPLGASVAVALLSVGVTALALLALALEGAVCIVMATPIALVFAGIGGVFGHGIASRTSHVTLALALTGVFLAPAIMGAEALSSRIAPLYVVTTSIDVDAPPDAVWHNVVTFGDLPPPTELAFRAGIAYPIRAKIVGHGVGAVRYCEFSTGDFVEPITVWRPGRLLAFSVVRSADPMREWSPYGRLDTPHLHDYMVSRRGQFSLEALPGGRTRLSGTTWYQHHLWPASYWALWSDAIVHGIHGRVLRHIKRLSESPSA